MSSAQEEHYRSFGGFSSIYRWQFRKYPSSWLNMNDTAMVEHPGDYPRSSYQVNGQGMVSELLKPHLMYEALGANPTERQAVYRELFRYELAPGVIDQIRDATNGNFVLGDNRFAEQIESTLGRRVRPGKSGRPCVDS